jgi:hypothetical protein
MTNALLNFSGHRLSEEAAGILEKRFSHIEEVRFQDIDFSGSVEDQVKELVQKARTPLDGSVPVSIIPPGHSTLSILLLVFLHGLLGYFPGICMLEARSPGKFLPTNVFHVDVNDLRNAGRAFRQELWK